MFKQETINELGQILKEDYGLKLSDNDLREFGEGLVEIFNLLYEADRGQKFEHRQRRSIDHKEKESL